MASYKFAAILAFLVAVTVIQSAQVQAQGANPAEMAAMPGLTPDQYNNMSSSIRTILFQMYQSLMGLVSAQQASAGNNNQAGAGANNNQS